jgi:hypothetical protein
VVLATTERRPGASPATRPALFERRRTYQRTVYSPGELFQFDLSEPRAEIPVGQGKTRRAWVVTAELGNSRALAAALVSSKEAPDLLFGMARCLARLGALAERSSGIARARSRPAAVGRLTRSRWLIRPSAPVR